MSIGENIRKIRLKKQLTQRQLGDLCGMADSAIRRYESDKATPKLETLRKIAKALEVFDYELDPSLIMSFDSGEEFMKEWNRITSNVKINEMKKLMESLNSKGQDKALEQVELLTKIPEYTNEN